MSSPSPPVLQQLHRLDQSLPGFCDELSNILDGKEYQKCMPNLQDHDSLKRLADHLDKVRRLITHPRSPLKPA